jgi:hypothetical protein
MLLTSGFIADFKTGYLQIPTVEHQCEVMGGTDDGDGTTSTAAVTNGYAVGRLVKLVRLSDGSCYLTTPGTVTATSIDEATHIIAQADDSLDTKTIRGEALNFNPTHLLKNTATGSVPTAKTATMKIVALWKITNSDDVKIITVKPSTVSVVR